MNLTIPGQLREFYNRGHLPALYDLQTHRPVIYTWSELFSLIERTFRGLNTFNITTTDRVAIWSKSRLEWIALEWALFASGIPSVSIIPGAGAGDLVEMINQSQASVLIIEDSIQYKVWQNIKGRCPLVEKVISIERIETIRSYTDLLVEAESRSPDFETFFKTAENIQPDQLAAIVFTSGTDGTPKVIELLHRNILSEVHEVFNYLDIEINTKTLNTLPFAHILGRIELWGHMYWGFQFGIDRNLQDLRATFQKFHPNIILSVPAIFEKLRDSLLSVASVSPVLKGIFELALQNQESNANSSKLSSFQKMTGKMAQKMAFDIINKSLGGELRFFVSGGAPCPKSLVRFFNAIGVPLLEGYGLTETCGAICVNTTSNHKMGSVGKPFGDVEIKISPEGEILIKSAKITPSVTLSTGSWFSTGDLGYLDAEGFLYVTGRKKDLIKTSGAKYVSPEKIENFLESSGLISRALVLGEGRKYITALLVLGPTYNGDSPTVQKEVSDYIAQMNQSLGPHESVKKYAILKEPFLLEKLQLTPSLKIRRNQIISDYSDLIESLYQS